MQHIVNENVLLIKTKKTTNTHLSRYYPWLVVMLCSGFLFYKYVLQVSPSIMASDLMRVFSINGVGLGNLAATYFYAYLLAQLFAGPLLDRYSPHIITSIAIAISALGTIIFASTSILLVAGLARGLIGIGAAFATVSYMKMTSIWFKPSQMAFVDGLLATAAMAGALGGQVPLAYLTANVGWQASLAYCGLFGFALAALFLLIVRDKPKEFNTTVSPTNPKKIIKLKEFIELLKKPENWVLTIYSGLVFTPVAVLGGLWGNPFFIEVYHLNPTTAASFTSCIFIGLALGGPVFGFTAGKFSRMKIMKLGTFVALFALTSIILSAQLPLWILAFLLFLFGFGTGSFMSCFSLGKELNDIKLTATVISLINTGDALFGSITEPFIGKILDINWNGEIINGVHHFTASNFKYAFSFLPIYLVGALICLNILEKNGRRNMHVEK